MSCKHENTYAVDTHDRIDCADCDETVVEGQEAVRLLAILKETQRQLGILTLRTEELVQEKRDREQQLCEQLAENAQLRQVLELIAAPKRSDGTYNRDREACGELARKALGDSPETITLSEQDSKAMLDALENPPEPNGALKTILKRPE